MDEREELKRELQWVKYRQRMLNIIEDKLLEMKEIAELAKQGNLAATELEELNVRLNDLAAQVKAIDYESRKIEDGSE